MERKELNSRQEQKKKKLKGYFQKGVLGVIAVLVMIKINKILFFLIVFYILGFLGKYIRGAFGLKMFVLDPNLFFYIIIVKFFGIKWLFVFLFLTVIVNDMVTGIFSLGSFLNYVLYHIAPIFAIAIFGNSSMRLYGNIASLIYSSLYFVFRTSFFFPSPLADDPFQVTVKAITSMIFTFLYIVFFGPIFQILLG